MITLVSLIKGGEKMKTATISAEISSEAAYNKGVEIGLTEEALKMFRHFNEVVLEIKIDDEGVVREAKVVIP